jgi:hypothetical protein
VGGKFRYIVGEIGAFLFVLFALFTGIIVLSAPIEGFLVESNELAGH